ncbi:MAG: M48 family metallopeptidase [Gammaproteobacteria bacterium]|nr:M48 family metallopeptidase [Gammaproteobacteria bacterium]
MNPLYKHLISLVLVAMVVAACSSTPTGRRQLTLKSDAALAQEGTRQMAIIRANSPLVQDQATIDYVACVANAIVETLEGDDAAMYWEMAIVNQPDVNAFVMPGGKIVVKSGILTVAQNQHQLAAVLGHEVAHVTANHANERASRGEITSYGVEVLALILGGGYYNQTQGAYGAASALNTLGIMNPFSRMQESEADIIGLEYMARAGFDPRESVELWQNMNSSAETAKIPEFMSTHPSGETRIESMVEQLPEMLALYNEAQAQGRNPDCQR